MFSDVAAGDLLQQVRAHDFGADPDLEADVNRIDAVVAMDRLIRSAQAEQVAQIAHLHRARALAMHIWHGDASLSVIGEVSMARNISPSAAGTQLGLALALDHLPAVMQLFSTGAISELSARAVVNESSSLGIDDYIVLDAGIAPQLPGLTHIKTGQATARAVIRIDAEAARVRALANRADNRVTMFPDTDGVAILQVRGKAEQIVAAYNVLDAWAHGLHGVGDERNIGQIMTETLIERVTGIVHADAVGVEIELVMDAETLLATDGEGNGDGDNAVELTGYGPISPDIADELIARAPDLFIRRLLVDPVDGTLVARDPHRRRFDGPLGKHVRARDRRCRQPGCDAKIRDADHIHEFADGGPTIKENAQGLCRRSHAIKGQPGWTVRSHGKASVWTTPTGHTYISHPPPILPQHQPPHHLQ
ncbi:HNH endonuclease signature motif containing protein [Aeromicrobium sp.]|uniref:HNH endonuclease signature motif containing protein n=1 Tax=Aeromicrobium sp. TaxID=1871063 RepID=UPI0019A83C70|nr:HNH endonuclease signature motif containing protein [Aeromicrobium sp.]MBC7632583.1 DUF222 domain-containing protein [Aeromicrobium sp.]